MEWVEIDVATAAMEVPGSGCLVRVRDTSLNAMAMTWVPGVRIQKTKDGAKLIQGMTGGGSFYEDE